MIAFALLLQTTASSPVKAVLPPDSARAEFSQVHMVRELPNGDVLVTDVRERALYLVRHQTLAVERVSREGDGPGELRSPGALLALAGDTTVVVDRRDRRRVYFVGTRHLKTVPGDASEARLIGAFAVGTDARGRVVALRGYSAPGTNSFVRGLPEEYPAMADSVAVLRIDLERSRVDTIARLDPFASEWQLPDGGRRYTRIAEPLEPVTAAERAFAVRHRHAGDGLRWEPEDFPHWPAQVPPFPERAVFAAPDGSVVLLRTPTRRRASPTYEVFDRAGRRVTSRTLSAGQRIVGFGQRQVYIVATDQDGVERLLRSVW